MINEIRTAFKDALDDLNWMDEQTRQAAKDKVSESENDWITQTCGFVWDSRLQKQLNCKHFALRAKKSG